MPVFPKLWTPCFCTTVNTVLFLVNKTNRYTEFQFYWHYDSTCFGQPFCPSSGVLIRTSALVHLCSCDDRLLPGVGWNCLQFHLTPGSERSSQLHKMCQSWCTAKNSWWWAERLPETCRVVIPIKLEFDASVGFIHKEKFEKKIAFGNVATIKIRLFPFRLNISGNICLGREYPALRLRANILSAEQRVGWGRSMWLLHVVLIAGRNPTGRQWVPSTNYIAAWQCNWQLERYWTSYLDTSTPRHLDTLTPPHHRLIH